MTNSWAGNSSSENHSSWCNCCHPPSSAVCHHPPSIQRETHSIGCNERPSPTCDASALDQKGILLQSLLLLSFSKVSLPVGVSSCLLTQSLTSPLLVSKLTCTEDITMRASERNHSVPRLHLILYMTLMCLCILIVFPKSLYFANTEGYSTHRRCVYTWIWQSGCSYCCSPMCLRHKPLRRNHGLYV